MNRARGRKGRNGTGRKVGPGENAEEGVSPLQSAEGSPIPGLTGNILNHPTRRQDAGVADDELPEHRGWLAHGVHPDEHTPHERAAAERGDNPPRRMLPVLASPTPWVRPIPVYITEGQVPDAIISAAPRHVTVAAIGGVETRLAGRNPQRTRIGLLNEDTATNVRFGTRPSDLNTGGGALLPWPTNAYQWFNTQDELFALTVSNSLTVVVSVIEEYEQAV
jgi:hypothetical protein